MITTQLATQGLPLNASQLEAAQAAINMPVLIQAAAGTGKTSTMIARVAHLLSQGIRASDILVMAFSRKAVEELRGRLSAAGAGAAVMPQTFHGWSFRLLSCYWTEAGFTAPPTVVAEDKLLDVLAGCLRWVKLKDCKTHACHWLGLEPTCSWPAVVAAAADAEPHLFDRCLQPHLASSADNRATSGLAQGAAAFVALGTRAKAAVLLELHLQLCKQHDPRRYRELMFDSAFDPASVSAQECQHCWAWMQQQQLPSNAASQMCSAAGSTCVQTEDSGQLEVFRRAAAFFQQELRRMNAVRLCELPRVARDLLSSNPSVLAQVRERWQFLIVDELQDLCPAQVDLVALLQEGRGQVTAVGDDDQSIMSFANATRDIFAHFKQRFAPKLVRLTINYRCTPAICAVGLAALKGNRRPRHEPMEAARASSADQPVLVQQYGTVDAEAAAVAASICKQIDGGRQPGDIAVLFRCLTLNGQAVYSLLAAELTRLDVPFTIARREKAADHEAVAEVLALLQVIANPDDDVALRKLISLQGYELGPPVLATLLEHQSEARLQATEPVPSLLACARSMCRSSTLPPASWSQPTSHQDDNIPGVVGWEEDWGSEHAKAAVGHTHFHAEVHAYAMMGRLSGLVQWVAELQTALSDKPLPEVVELALAGPRDTGSQDLLCGLEEQHEACSSGKSLRQGEDSAAVQALLADCKSFCLRWQTQEPDEQLKLASLGMACLRDFLGHLEEGNQACQAGPGQAVTVTTIHAAKGLEWPAVFMPTVNDYYLPVYFRPVETDDSSDDSYQEALEAHLAEERRLFHVAATRARDMLGISYVQGPGATVLCPVTRELKPMRCSSILCDVVSQLEHKPVLTFMGRLPDEEHDLYGHVSAHSPVGALEASRATREGAAGSLARASSPSIAERVRQWQQEKQQRLQSEQQGLSNQMAEPARSPEPDAWPTAAPQQLGNWNGQSQDNAAAPQADCQMPDRQGSGKQQGSKHRGSRPQAMKRPRPAELMLPVRSVSRGSTSSQ